MQGYSKAANTKPLPGIYNVGEVLGLDGVWGYFGYRSDITEPLGFVQDA